MVPYQSLPLMIDSCWLFPQLFIIDQFSMTINAVREHLRRRAGYADQRSLLPYFRTLSYPLRAMLMSSAGLKRTTSHACIMYYWDQMGSKNLFERSAWIRDQIHQYHCFIDWKALLSTDMPHIPAASPSSERPSVPTLTDLRTDPALTEIVWCGDTARLDLSQSLLFPLLYIATIFQAETSQLWHQYLDHHQATTYEAALALMMTLARPIQELLLFAEPYTEYVRATIVMHGNPDAWAINPADAADWIDVCLQQHVSIEAYIQQIMNEPDMP